MLSFIYFSREYILLRYRLQDCGLVASVIDVDLSVSNVSLWLCSDSSDLLSNNFTV